MNEYTVVTVIVTLVGLVVTVMVPILKLNGSIVSLTAKMDGHDEDIKRAESKSKDMEDQNRHEHEDMYGKINNHESRINHLERK